MTTRKVRYEKETSILSKKGRRSIKLIIETGKKIQIIVNSKKKVLLVEKNKNFY